MFNKLNVFSKGVDNDPSAPIGHKYEAVFSVFLIVLAFLYKDNPTIVYPQILYLFLILFALNLSAGFLLRRWPSMAWVSALIILGNCATITGILDYSGGAESNLWVLYLLPVFTACLLLNGKQVLLITAGAVSFNVSFHMSGEWYRGLDDQDVFNVCIKTGILVFAAAVTWRIASKDRKTQGKLAVQRNDLSRLEEQISDQQAHLQQYEKMADVGQVSSGVAHDLNNPLTVIFGTVMILLEDVAAYPQIKNDLDRIVRSTQLCKNIVSNMLNFARNNNFAMTTCQVNDLIESTLQLYESTLTQSSIHVVRSLTAKLPSVRVSIPQFQRVMLNLMANARSVMKTGGTLTIRTEQVDSPRVTDKPRVRIVVEDTGPGIAPEFMEKLFKPFNSTKLPGEGTGLGLYLSREIITQHGGTLMAENKLPNGARFTVHLPGFDAEPAPSQENEVQAR